MNEVVQRLEDETAIRNLAIRMSLAMDTRDYDLFRAQYADEISLDIPAIAGDAVTLAGTLKADDYARDVITLLSQFKATQHCSTNHDVRVDGDTGTCACYTLATHHFPMEDGDQWSTIGARYDITAQRFSDGWKMVKFKWTKQWESGNNAIWAEAGRRVAELQAKK
jgi:hypothetical protein